MIGSYSSRGEIKHNVTNSLRIGPVKVPNRVILAPMSGITDAPFRRLAERHGAGLVVSEMTACAALVEGQREARTRSEGQGVTIHVVQLAGCEAHWMAEGARIAEAQGAHIIDINMGCPSKQVTNGAAGSALMRDPEHAIALIEATVAAVRVPVTLKMRLGWDHANINAPELARRAESRRRSHDHRAWPHPLPILYRRGRLAGGARGEAGRHDPGRRQRRYSFLRRRDRARWRRPARTPSWSDAPRRAVHGFPGRWRATSQRANASPRRRSSEQFTLIDTLYDEMLSHHGLTIGRRHARKHLAWALDCAAATAGVSTELLKSHRARVLTAEEPAHARRLLADAYDAFAWRAAA